METKAAEMTAPPLESQKQIIEELLKATLRKGDE